MTNKRKETVVLDRDELMHRARAYKCLSGSSISKRSEYFMFLTVTHPEMSLEKRLTLANKLAKNT